MHPVHPSLWIVLWITYWEIMNISGGAFIKALTATVIAAIWLRSAEVVIQLVSFLFEPPFYVIWEKWVARHTHVIYVTRRDITQRKHSWHSKNCFTFSLLKEVHIARLVASDSLTNSSIVRFKISPNVGDLYIEFHCTFIFKVSHLRRCEAKYYFVAVP